MTVHVQTCRAVHANVGVQAWYYAQLRALINEASADLTQALTPLLQNVDVPVGTPTTAPKPLTTDAAPDVTKIKRTVDKWASKWKDKIDALAPKIATQFTLKAYSSFQNAFQSALRDAGFTVRFKPSKASMQAYRATLAENVDLIKSIPQQYATQVQSLVWESVRVGGDMHTLSVKLQKQYGVSTNRAALIARDQNNKAKATIEATRRREIGITLAVWQHSHGGVHPRPTHVAMDGKLYEIDKGMFDSDENEYVQPGQLINCRCTSRPVIPGLARTGG